MSSGRNLVMLAVWRSNASHDGPARSGVDPRINSSGAHHADADPFTEYRRWN